VAPGDARFYDGLGTIRYEQDQIDDALKFFQEFIALNSKDVRAHLFLSKLYDIRLFKDGLTPDKALEQLNTALSLCPESEWIHIAMGELLSKRIVEPVIRIQTGPQARPSKPTTQATRSALNAKQDAF
jgi:tetratricopeptide (TPR) repeat protein